MTGQIIEYSHAAIATAREIQDTAFRLRQQARGLCRVHPEPEPSKPQRVPELRFG
jgi:hypothetical protein